MVLYWSMCAKCYRCSGIVCMHVGARGELRYIPPAPSTSLVLVTQESVSCLYMLSARMSFLLVLKKIFSDPCYF